MIRRYLSAALLGVIAFLLAVPTFATITTLNDTISYQAGTNYKVADVVVTYPATASGTAAQQVQGNSAAGATDAGNPVKVGAIYSSTLPTLTNGQRGNLQQGTRGSLNVTLMTADSVTAIQNAANSTDTTGTGLLATATLAQLDDTSPSAVTENQFANLRMNSARAQYVENGPYSATRLTADGSVKASAGFVHTISIAPTTATPTAGLLSVYANTAESGTVIYSEWVFATTPGHTITIDAPFATGIFVGYDATLANASVTVSFR